MSKRINNDVTLEHEDALALERMLGNYADRLYSHAKRSYSAAVREALNMDLIQALEMRSKITKNLWSWVE